MLYELWETTTINLVASYDDRREALAAILDGVARNGPQSIETLALEVEDDEGNITSIAHGRDLAELARRELGALPLAG